MEVQDTRDSRREVQTIQEAIGQQNLVLQRMERNLRRLEDSYGKLTSRLDAVESARIGPDPAPEKGRPGHLVRSGSHDRETPRGIPGAPAAKAEAALDPPSGSPPEQAPASEPLPESTDSGSTPAPHTSLITRAKSTLRGAILDGSVNVTLDKVQSSLKLADEATGALSQISAMVKASLEGSADTQQSGAARIPGGSLALLLDLAKTPQFQKFIAGIIAQFLKDAGPDQALSPGKSPD